MRLIKREKYFDELVKLKNISDIKVITGVRRSGKSSLMEIFIEHIAETEPDVNIIRANLLLKENEDILEYHSLYNHIESHYQSDKENLVCIDEVQMCEHFEKAISWLYESHKYNIYITGSNAFLLSSDLATLFTGRSFEIKVYPFSLAEFMEYFGYTNPYESLNQYISSGGMAGSYPIEDEGLKFRYISSVFTTLIIRDIKAKNKIRNLPLLNQIADFLMDNISNITSVKNIVTALSKNSSVNNHKTVAGYIDYLCCAYLFYKVRRYDIAGKRYLASQDKYYLCDHSFRYAKLGTKNMDYGRILENIVAIELLRRGYEVYVGVLYKKEVDFVALKQNEKLYIQVADDISNPETFKREYTPLLAVRDAYPKIILARTGHDTYDYEGIRICDIGNWLIGRE